MMYAFIFTFLGMFIFGGALGYLVGRFEGKLTDKIRTLEAKAREVPKPEPAKPSVTGGAYQPPKPVSTTVESKQGAGLVESKTPERLDWESKEEIRKLEHSS